jgi:hypothetical protein
MKAHRLAAILACFAAAPAWAQTAPPPPAPDVSQLNGQLVKVGERNEYELSFPRWNVSTNPIGWILGAYGLSVSYGPHPNFALRADVNYFHPVDTDMQGYELGVGAPIYFRRTYQGVFLEPGLIVRHFEDKNVDSYSSTVFGPQVLVGWHWMWDSGLNVAIAAGAGRNWSTHSGDGYYDNESVFFNGYLRFGYAFQ